MAAATVEPPLRPRAMICGVLLPTKSSFASTTLTKPTGAAIKSAGFSCPASMSSLIFTSAVGALPIARISGRSAESAAARSIETVARVTPLSLASAATSASAIKQRAVAPKPASLALLMPASAILVSVTMQAPCRIASLPCSTTPSEKSRVSANEKSAVVCMTRFTTKSTPEGNCRSPSSSPIRRKLSASISSGFQNSILISQLP